MSRASALALAGELAGGQASPTHLEQFYDDTVLDVAKQALFNVLEIVPASAGVGLYAKPEHVVAMLAAFYDDTMLSLVTQRSLEATTPDWRDVLGTPACYMIEDLSHDQFRVFPTPTLAGGPVIPMHGQPFGLDYPSGTLAVLGSDKLEDMPEWMDLPLALTVLAREFGRPSQHMDQVFAGACKSLAAMLLMMVG